MRQKLRAQWSHAHPGSGGQLEILRDAAIEDKSLARIAWIHKLQCVAQTIKSVFVETRARQVRLPPIARSDAGPLQACLGLQSGLDQLQLDTRRGQSDMAG